MRTALLMLMTSLLVIPNKTVAQSDMYEGQPSFAQGAELGYYIWKDGNNWHVRWTTMGRMRHFTGSVVSDGGELKSLKQIDVESERRVLYPGRRLRVVVGPRGRTRVARGGPLVVEQDEDRIDKESDNRITFNARTNDDIDGFDFKVDVKANALRFVLEIDGIPMPNVIEVGKNNQKPGSLPLDVQLK